MVQESGNEVTMTAGTEEGTATMIDEEIVTMTAMTAIETAREVTGIDTTRTGTPDVEIGLDRGRQ